MYLYNLPSIALMSLFLSKIHSKSCLLLPPLPSSGFLNDAHSSCNSRTAHLSVLETMNIVVKLITTNIPYIQDWTEKEKNGRTKIYIKYT